MKYDWLIVGLGNPKEKYLHNRHNIGWMVAESLCKRFNRNIISTSKNFYQSNITFENEKVLIIFPTTYMNRSGEAVLRAIQKYDIDKSKIIVISDEYNFPVGKVHLRFDGGDGGHNGIISIINEIESPDFFRLRCGIDRNFKEGEMADYVLSDFDEKEIEQRDYMINKAVDSIVHLLRVGKNRAMTDINSESLWKIT